MKSFFLPVLPPGFHPHHFVNFFTSSAKKVCANVSPTLGTLGLILLLLSCAPSQTQGQKADISSTSSVTAMGKPAPKGVMVPPSRPAKPLMLQKVASLRNEHIQSPKSALFTEDGSKIYVQSLEGGKTVVLDAKSMQVNAVIPHTFSAANAELFLNGETAPFDYVFNTGKERARKNDFFGKPVESALSHNGKYLWVTYYRRSYDTNASSPSALAIIDTSTDSIVRVMPTGPLPKMVTISPDSRRAAVVHWGDNTVALLDISSPNPKEFKYTSLLTVGRRLDLSTISGNRDANSGFCLRGAAFSKDGKYLFVARMSGGGMTVLDIENGNTLGLVSQLPATPRHLVMNREGSLLYVSSNKSGMVTELPVDKVLSALQEGTSTAQLGRSLYVGTGARTIVLSPDEKTLFAACNNPSQLVVVDIATWKVRQQIHVSPYGVGLAVSPDGATLITTSQGRGGEGGHVLDVFAVAPHRALAKAHSKGTEGNVGMRRPPRGWHLSGDKS